MSTHAGDGISGALQHAMFSSAHFSCIATDEKGLVQVFNVGAERMLGYSASDVIDRMTHSAISDPQEMIEQAAALSLEFGVPIEPGFEALSYKAARGIEDIYEMTKIRRDGSRFPAIVSVTALRNPQDQIIGYLLIGTDNTARKTVEADWAMRDQRQRDQQFYTRSLIEKNVDALMTIDRDGVITDVNQQMVALTGSTREALIGSPFRNCFTDPLRADAAIACVLAENRLSNYELTVRARDGIETMVSYNATSFSDRDGRPGVFASARDVTEVKRFERALQEKNSELEHASRMKSEFLTTMSHELRTPLNAIIGFSEALKEGLIGEMSDAQREYIGDIFTSGQHLLSLINDILDLSKVEAGMMVLDLEPVDLGDLLSRSLSIVREKATSQQISLELDAGDDLGVPALDLRKTKQIVYNLLSNAVKFSPAGGRVILRARRVSRSAVGTIAGDWPSYGFPLAESDYDQFLEICVSDNGIGISKEDLPKLFQPFCQIDSSLARKFEGTGLGLAMIKQLAELHGGAVAVASVKGEGATFAVWLPQRNPGHCTGTPAGGPQKPPAKRIALLIEHDDATSDLVRLLLEAEGFSVVRVASAEAALMLRPDQVPSLITLDLELPDAEGLRFLQKLRENSVMANVPVVLIAGPADSNMALTGGAASILQKPISRAQLKDCLETLGLPPIEAHVHTILVVDDDPTAVEVIAAFLPSPAYAVVRAYGGEEAIILARRLRPDLILLDLMMPEVNGFAVVEALQASAETARIPILVVTAKCVTDVERAALNSHPENVIHVVEKAGFNRRRFVAEVQRALTPR